MEIVPLLFAMALLLGWLLSEFQPRRWLRIVLGSACLGLGVLLAYGIGELLQGFRDNIAFCTATADLVDTTIAQLEKHRCDQTLAELRHFRQKCELNYETHPQKFAEGVREFKKRITAEDQPAEPSRAVR